jgi:hypothetical protein
MLFYYILNKKIGLFHANANIRLSVLKILNTIKKYESTRNVFESLNLFLLNAYNRQLKLFNNGELQKNAFKTKKNLDNIMIAILKEKKNEEILNKKDEENLFLKSNNNNNNDNEISPSVLNNNNNENNMINKSQHNNNNNNNSGDNYQNSSKNTVEATTTAIANIFQTLGDILNIENIADTNNNNNNSDNDNKEVNYLDLI